MEEFFEGVFEALFEFLAEGFCELVSSITPQKNISKKSRNRIKFILSVYAMISIVLLLASLVIFCEFPNQKFLGIIFVCNFVLLLLTAIISIVVKKIKNKRSQ